LSSFALGLVLSSGTFPDFVQDVVNDLRVTWHLYRLSAGATGTLYLMVSGYLLGQGSFLTVRQLWTRVLRPLRSRWGEVDAARDFSTGLPSRFALATFLEKSVKWAEPEASTRHVAVALFHLNGLERLNEFAGTNIGTELLYRISKEIRNGSVPELVTGVRRMLARAQITPSSILNAATPPSRCPGRWSGATFAIAYRGVESRRTVFLAQDMLRHLDAMVREVNPEAELSMTGSLVLFSLGATVRDMADAAEKALEVVAGPGGLIVAHGPGEGSASMLEEFKELPRFPLTLSAKNLRVRPAVDDEEETFIKKFTAWGKAWGLAVACLAAVPVILYVGDRGELIRPSFPWPADVTAVPSLGAKGVQSVAIVRNTAAAVSDGTWMVDDATIAQMDATAVRGAVVQVHLSVTNRSPLPQHFTMFDISVLDDDGKQLKLDPGTSLRFENALGAKTIGPGESWSGWLQYARGTTPARALVVQPSRANRLYLPMNSGDAAPSARLGPETR
jgi:GGDEF domain-containing protein